MDRNRDCSSLISTDFMEHDCSTKGMALVSTSDLNEGLVSLFGEQTV